MKTCFKCGGTFPLEAFYRHPQMGDGLLGKCKECTKADVRANRAARLQQYRDYDKERAMAPWRVAARAEYALTERGREVVQQANARWTERNPDKRWAHTTLNNAVRDGRVIARPCRDCGAKAHGHHPDYSKPLDVIWLCPKHHKAEHARMAREVAA